MNAGSVHGLTTPFSHGRAFTETLFPTSPAAGSGFSLTVSGAYYERFTGCTFTLATSATVVTRSVTVDYVNPGAGRFLSAGPTATQAQSSTNVYNGTLRFGASDWNTGTPAFFSLPDLILPSGFQLQINVAGIDTTDALTKIAFVRERFQTGQDGFPIGYVSTDEYLEQYVPLGL